MDCKEDGCWMLAALGGYCTEHHTARVHYVGHKASRAELTADTGRVHALYSTADGSEGGPLMELPLPPAVR